MEDKFEEILAQYPIQIKSKKRVRGAILLETERGLSLLRSYNGYRSHLQTEEKIKQYLVDQGYPYVDQAIKNAKDEFLTRDGAGNLWILRKWYAGRECDIREAKEVHMAAAHLAKLHQLLVHPLTERPEQSASAEMNPETVEQDLAKTGLETAEQESVKTDLGTVEQESAAMENESGRTEVSHAFFPTEKPYFEKRNRELKRVHSFIRKKRHKNEMELALLNAFGYYYEQGCEAERIDAEEQVFQSLYRRSLEEELYVHGSYNYHNLLLQGKRIATTNFENSKPGIQILDLYGFLRKVMEKNGWQSSLGTEILDAYQRQRDLSEYERKLLYTLLLYPEKYWKQCNFYYNGKKSWTSRKNLDKLQRLQEQETERCQFLESVKGVLF